MLIRNFASSQNKFFRHTSILIWKSYLQRQRRWRTLAFETVFAMMLLSIALFVAYPVFLTPLQAEPEPPVTGADLLRSLRHGALVGYAPLRSPYIRIMERAAVSLGISLMSAETEDALNDNLYRIVKNNTKRTEISIIWVIWRPKVNNTWRFSIRSSELARYESVAETAPSANPHLRAGFLALQVAVSQAILEEEVPSAKYEVKLVSMPVSPLMQEASVRRVVSVLLQCLTAALLPPVLETQALVLRESVDRFKRSLRIRGTSSVSLYCGWLVFAYMTALPICFTAAVALLLVFRWVHLLFALALLLAYISAMILTALIMAMFHSKAWIACVWSALYTVLQTYLAVLLVHHEYDVLHGALTFFLHLLIPPLGLVHALNHFALLSIGKQRITSSLWYSFGSWAMLIVIYFILLMLLQNTVGHERAVGGQMPWKSVIFRKTINPNALHRIETLTGRERDNLQKVDELVAKAISFRNVSKSIMGVEVLKNVTFDIYRGEFSMLFADRVQEIMITAIEDILTGLTYVDHGSINVLGTEMSPDVNLMVETQMMGYCHLPAVLTQDLTVDEHLMLYSEICLWKETRTYLRQYSMMRSSCLLRECDLQAVRSVRVQALGTYYRAQLCWAIAMLLEPRIIIVPSLSSQHPMYNRVITDKTMQYRKYLTIVKVCYSSLKLEYADRVFIFDRRVVAFAGTPAYMFFKYGREYRVRMTIPTKESANEDSVKELIESAAEVGGAVRTHTGSLLILRLPTEPSAAVAKFVKHVADYADYYGIKSLHISVPDSEEVVKRALMESRSLVAQPNENSEVVKNALKRIAEPPKWRRRESGCVSMSQLMLIGKKHFAFHVHYRLYFFITFLSAILAGIFMGLSLSTLLASSKREEASGKLIHGELTMEYTKLPSSLVVRADKHKHSMSLANAYVFSEPDAKPSDIARIYYTALDAKESLTEYLVTRAIDSPQMYVTLFAYGMDVKTTNDTIMANALYSPLHSDHAAAARSLAKVYSSLLRHYSGVLDASIQVLDEPLTLDLTPWMESAKEAPLLVQFLLIMVVSHMTLLPSFENGFIRHTQSHALNFSPLRYWLTLFFWDIMLYSVLVCVMFFFLLFVMWLVAPPDNLLYEDLLIMPIVLTFYGLASVPQAYLFSLGPRVALNFVTFIIVNIIFGETTIAAQLFYGNVLDYAVVLMNISPQFNMAYAFVKIKQIFLYNSECLWFESQHLCANGNGTVHKCCEKCGILQDCFEKRGYFTMKTGVLNEIIALAAVTVLFTAILLVVEYKVIKRLWVWRRAPPVVATNEPMQDGASKERELARNKWLQIKDKIRDSSNPYGECLLAYELTRRERGVLTIRDVSVGVGRGQALAVVGLRRHGRETLVDLLAGYRLPDDGHAVSTARWKLRTDPHKYARQISASCARSPLPGWLRVRDALSLQALLRGVPATHAAGEVDDILQALELEDISQQSVRRVRGRAERARLSLAAAAVGAPPALVLDECAAHQADGVRGSIYSVLHCLRGRGHAIVTAASNVESHLPVTNRLAFLLDGAIFDVDSADELVTRHGGRGFTAVLHLKDEVDVAVMFAQHFTDFVINDYTEVLVNVQILDEGLDWATVFAKMEVLKETNERVYSYIITVIPIDYIYNSVIHSEKGNRMVSDFVSIWRCRRETATLIKPNQEKLAELIPFERKYEITRLKELPWTVIFHT